MNIERILEDSELRNELDAKVSPKPGIRTLRPKLFHGAAFAAGELNRLAESPEGSLRKRAIIRRFGRPVLFIQQNAIAVAESEVWKSRIDAARANLEAVIPSIGRIAARHHPSKAWLGTGWLVAPDVLVTNRHVAIEFGRKGARGFAFRRNPAGRKMSAKIDFRKEHEQKEKDEFRISDILHIEEDGDDKLDLAFLRVETTGTDDQALPTPIPLSTTDPHPDQTVGIIGYAAWDGRRNDQDVMTRIFDDIYNVKRLHPGEVMATGQRLFNHDCSTLGGNSGSPVIDFATGEALGIHFAGTFELENYAVKATTIRERLNELGLS